MTNFETEPCSRCDGTGRHSFNGEHGRCYKCDGKNGGRALTKRGAAAKKYYADRFQVPVTSIVVGDLVARNGYKVRVIEIKIKPANAINNGATVNGNTIQLIGEKTALHMHETGTVRKFPTEEENKAAIQDALAYQCTLTKAGTPRKL